jgi:hypothetical protein
MICCALLLRLAEAVGGVDAIAHIDISAIVGACHLTRA